MPVDEKRGDQILVSQPRRLRQHRPGNRDVVVAGQALDDLLRRIGDRRDLAAQLDARAAFDVLDQADHDAVEHRGHFLGDAVVPGQKKTGDVL
jgi:hypothetical protein